MFKKCDITNWADVVSFFQCAYNKFGGIDAVVSNAGINKPESFDEPSGGVTTEASKLKPPDISVLRVNVVGTWYVTKCAMHFFGKHSETSSQLVLFGSVASFFDTPPLYTYCSSKGAVMGLMRALRTQVNKQNVTVNMIAPAMTRKMEPLSGIDPELAVLELTAIHSYVRRPRGSKAALGRSTN